MQSGAERKMCFTIRRGGVEFVALKIYLRRGGLCNMNIMFLSVPINSSGRLFKF